MKKKKLLINNNLNYIVYTSLIHQNQKLNTDDCNLIFPFYFQANLGYLNGNFQYSENLARYTKDIVTSIEEKYEKSYDK